MNTNRLTTHLLLGFGIVCATVAWSNVWDDCTARYGGRVDGAATGAFTKGSLLDSRHGANTSGPTMANVQDWHANKGGRSMTFRTENVMLNTRATTYVSDAVAQPTVLSNATVLHLDHPVVTNADESVVCKRSALYFPLCTIWGEPTALTYLLRFRLDKEQFLETSGLWDYCNILMSDWAYEDGGHGFRIWVKPTETDNQLYLCYGHRMDGNYIRTGLYLTNAVWTARGEMWAELAIIVKDAHNARLGLGLPGSQFQWRDMDCKDIKTLLPRQNYNIMLGGDGTYTDTAQSHLECARMSIHLFAAWTRALSDREVFEAFSDTGMGVVRAGCAGAAADAFTSDGTADVAFDATNTDWRTLPTVLPTGRSVAISFTPNAGYAGRAQLARVTAAANSPNGSVEVLVDGVSVGTAAVRTGKTVSVYVEGNRLGAGAHVLAFKSCAGNLILDSYELSGSRAFGEHGRHWHDKGIGSGYPANFYLENGNLKNLTYLAGQNLVLTLPADVAGRNRYSYTTYIAEGQNLPSVTLTVNGAPKLFIENPTISDMVPVTATFEPGELQAGENIFRWTIGGGWIIFDDHIFEVGKASSGLAVSIR